MPSPAPHTEPAARAARAHWAELADAAGLDPDVSPQLGDELVERYREPHRHYHDLRHLLAVLATVAELSEPSPADPEVLLAAWFHDAVHEGVAGDDEERSAELAERRLADAGWPAERARRVGDMVRATAGHLSPDESPHATPPATALLLDADLAILAAPEDDYDAYTRGVRAEHADVDDDDFRAGRAAAIRALLGHAALFHTDAGRARFERPARLNLGRELATLVDRDDPGSGGTRRAR